MNISDLFHETYRALFANKARSSLTILGIVIGISSVIATVSIGQGASKVIQGSIEGLGSNVLTVMPGIVQPGRGIVSSGRGSAQTLTNADVDVLQALDGVAHVVPELDRRFQIVASGGNNTNSTVVGTVPEYAIVRTLSVRSGSFITESQTRSMGRVVVLGPTAAFDLFGEPFEFVKFRKRTLWVKGLRKFKFPSRRNMRSGKFLIFMSSPSGFRRGIIMRSLRPIKFRLF